MESPIKNTYQEKFFKLLYFTALFVLALFLLTRFGNIVFYLALSYVIALLAQPLMRLLEQLTIRGKAVPKWLGAIIALTSILAIFLAIGMVLTPVFSDLLNTVSDLNLNSDHLFISSKFERLNGILISSFGLEKDFRLETLVISEVKGFLNFSNFSAVIGSVASVLAGMGIGFFSIVFISFFLIKDRTLISRAIGAMMPARFEENVTKAITDINHLLSRYFVGLTIEMLSVSLIDFLGLYLIARLDLGLALGIGFMAGLLNIIPYLGPLIGTVTGALMALVINYAQYAFIHPDVGILTYLVILVGVFLLAQLVDNALLQPLIYSTSIKARPLEIFIVLLLAGTLGGMTGMLCAIPAYTILRVIAATFFSEVRFIRFLTRTED